MAENRYVGEYPVIGIRPTIDGRRGYLKVRESLEEQTMNMARAAARLFEENLRYSNGALAERSVPARDIWPVGWLPMHRKGCLLSAFTDTMCRRRTIPVYRRM